MFAADLSWTDDTTEKVGERRQRKGKDSDGSVTSSTDSNNHQRRPSTKKGSLSGKTSFSSVKGSFPKSSTTGNRQVRKHTLPPIITGQLKDPLEQPADWVLSGKYIPKGAVLDDPPPPFLPEMNLGSNDHGRILYSRYENGSPNDPHKAWAVSDKKKAEDICQSYEQVKDEIFALQTGNPDGLLKRSASSRLGRYNAGIPESQPSELPAEESEVKITPPRRNPSRLASREGSAKREALLPTPEQGPLELPAIFRSMTIAREEVPKPPPPPLKDLPKTPKTPPNISRWQAPSSWDIPSATKVIRNGSPTVSSPSSSPDQAVNRRSEADMMSHFQRFVRRMEGAGPRIILERLKEEWDETADRQMGDELQLEKHLWALTALQLRALDRFARPSQSPAPSGPLPPLSLNRRRKILELDGSIGEIYQLSAIYPDSKVAHLTTAAQSSSIPLPQQATQHAISITSPTNSVLSIPISAGAGFLPLPYANSSMHHIRSARLAALLPAAQLPALLSECFRVLKPGGVLELRLMDATPERGSMGPRLATWLEERLLLGLERIFRCQRPVMLVPRWAQEAGFRPLPFRNEVDAQGLPVQRYSLGKLGLARCLRLPAAAVERESGNRDVVAQVGVLVGRALWKDAWGTFVHGDEEEDWWWDSPEVVEECREWKTVWDVGTLYVVKEDKV